MADGLFNETLAIPLDAQIRCVEREISMRERVYQRWVDEKKMTQKTADREIASMKAVLETLQSVKSKPEGRT